jgi:protein disulfide-isomerase A6
MIEYDGGSDEESLIEYLNKECGTHRAVGGGLLSTAGLDDALTVFAAEFLKTTDESEQNAIIESATARGISFLLTIFS